MAEVKHLILWTVGGVEPPRGQKAVEDIYNRYKRLMFATAGKYTENPADREDIVQTALERLVKILSSDHQSERSISGGYIVCTVRSVAIDFLRKRGQETEHCAYVEEDALAEAARTDGTLDDLILPSENGERLRAVWPRLPVEDRILLEGKYILCQTDKELAGILNCKIGSVRMKLTRARRRALGLLSERGSDEQT